jgi:hypothetical protein
MNILTKIEQYLDDFALKYNWVFGIDTIRVNFNKGYTISRLKDMGRWQKLRSDDKILLNLQKQERDTTITTAYKLKGKKILYYNLQSPPKYDKARLLIYGMKQYNQNLTQKAINREAIIEALEIVGNSAINKKGNINVDICYDTEKPPNLKELKKSFILDRYKNTSTYYINTPNILGLERVVIYDKQSKNTLESTLYRIEATIRVYNIKALTMPLEELVTDIIQPLQRSNNEPKRA